MRFEQMHGCILSNKTMFNFHVSANTATPSTREETGVSILAFEWKVSFLKKLWYRVGGEAKH